MAAPEADSYDPTAVDYAAGRRNLSLDVKSVELRLYRRTRTSADTTPVPPHFVYHVRCIWSGTPTPGAPPALHRPPALVLTTSPGNSPRSPRSAGRPVSAGRAAGALLRPPWWHDLPEQYVLRRSWQDLVNFHEALAKEIAWDKQAGIRRTKSKIPALPERADIGAWHKGYAAAGDALALRRRQPVMAMGAQREASLEDLRDLHWIYVEHRLGPYFVEVNRLLRELPTDVLLGSKALRRFVTGGVIGRGQVPPSRNFPVPCRFLGPLVPLLPDKEDLVAAARALRRSASAPFAGGGGDASPLTGPARRPASNGVLPKL